MEVGRRQVGGRKVLNQATGLAAALGLSVVAHAALYWHSSPSQTRALAFSPPQGKAGAKVTVRVVQQQKSTRVEAEPTPPAPAPPAPEFEKPTPHAVRRVEGLVPPQAELKPPAVVARRNTQSNWVAAVGEVRVEAAASAPPPRPKPLTPPVDVPKPPDRVRPREEAVLAEAQVVAQLNDVAAFLAVKSMGAETTHPPQATFSPEPTYPPRARAEWRQGDVVVWFRLDAHGVVHDPRVERSSGHPDLDAQGLKEIVRWRFRPSHRGGVSEGSTHLKTFHFRIKDSAT